MAMPTMTVSQLDNAIAADPTNAKLYGKRCTSLLAAGQHTAALEDAKTLVRLLPDAPVGYLKAARCYRLLSKLKASKRMLEMAIERGADEITIKAVRTEQRKLQEDRLRLAEERSRSFIDILPHEIFIEIASYLPQRDLIRASQVNKTWRETLHSRPQLWTTMFLNIPKLKTNTSNSHLRRIDDQIRFYEDRLSAPAFAESFPSSGSPSSFSLSSSGATAANTLTLKHLSIHSSNSNLNEAILPWSQVPRFKALLFGSHRFTRNLTSFAISNVPGEFAVQWLNMLCSPCSSSSPSVLTAAFNGNSNNGGSSTLQALRIATTAPLGTECYLKNFPNLRVLEKFDDSRSAELDSNWPWLDLYDDVPSSLSSSPSSYASSSVRSNVDMDRNASSVSLSTLNTEDNQLVESSTVGTRFPIRRIAIQGRLSIGAGADAGAAGADSAMTSGQFNNLTHLSFGGHGSAFSFFFTQSPMTQLRHLSLNNALFIPDYVLPRGVAPFDITQEGGLALSSLLETPLDLPHLESLELIYSDAPTGSTTGWARTNRTRLRPSVYLCRLKAPRLRTLKIDNFGSIVPASSLRTTGQQETQATASRERGTWLKFCQEHGETIEEITINKTAIPQSELVQSLPYLTNLRKLSLSSIELSPNFLKAATSPSLPFLQHLAVSYCSNINSGGDLVRFIQSKDKEVNQIKVLEIEGCTELQKEVVDWCRKVIPRVGWVGWGNKNETRSFGYR